MMNGIQVFNNNEFGKVRTMVIDNQPWFVGKDVAEALGYSEPRSAVSKKVDEADRGVAEMDTPSGKQKMTTINESGLYALIFSSRLDSAKRFKRWITSDVLPTLRKTGSYSMSNRKDHLKASRLIAALEETAKAQREALDVQKELLEMYRAENKRMKDAQANEVKVAAATALPLLQAPEDNRSNIKLRDLYTRVVKAGGKVSVGNFYDDLVQQGLIEKSATGVYYPTKKATDAALLVSKTKKYNGASYQLTLVTPKMQDIITAKYMA